MTNLVHVQHPSNLSVVPSRESLQDKMNLAKLLASASMLPKNYQENPGNCLLAVLFGEAVGVNAAVAIWGTHIIGGRPVPSASMMAGLVIGRGHKLRITHSDSTKATAVLVRHDDPDHHHSSTWTIEMAKNAGLLNSNENWKKYPAQMLKRRAMAEVGRDACPEILLGLYTPDELGYLEDAQGNLVVRDGLPVRAEDTLVTTDAPPADKPKRQYTRISHTKDVPKEATEIPLGASSETANLSGQEQKETPVRVPDASLQGFFDPEAAAVEGEIIEEPAPPAEEDPAPLRNQILVASKELWGDKATARLKEFCAGASLKSATADQCRTWLERLATLKAGPQDELGGLDV